MRILVDADAVPRPVREILCRVAEREQIAVDFVANCPVRLPPSALLRSIVAADQFNSADDKIVELAAADGPSHLVITADIPLADRAVTLGAAVLDPRGELHTPASIKSRLAMRDLMEDLRAEGVVSGGPRPYSARDRDRFTNALNKWLAATRRRILPKIDRNTSTEEP